MADWRTRSMQRLASFSRPAVSLASPEELRRQASPAAALEDPQDILALPLPNEMTTSIQNFLVNLTSPIHKAPFSPEKLTAMFQDFYSGTFDVLHDLLPEPGTPAEHGQEEMLSKEMMQARKERRKAFEDKQAAWREDIEERVCLEMYDSLFELRTSTDELRDEALMSKIIAISLIGITLEQLGVDLKPEEVQAMRPTIKLVGENLQNLNNAMTPRSKLDILLQCHKQIVDEVQQSNTAVLTPTESAADDLSADLAEAQAGSLNSPTKSQPSTSTRHLGADAILPIFIYAIIKSNPAKLVSHYEFICRFRARDSMTGEMAYCLTNLEAAIGFLETFEFTDGTAGDPLTGTLGPSSSYVNRSGSQASLLTTGSGAATTTGGLSGSLRASERARALSSAANDVYELADERMKQFGSQLGAIVSRVSEHQSLDDVRHLVGLPAAAASNTASGRIPSDRQKFTEVEQRVKARKALEGSATPPARPSRPTSLMFEGASGTTSGPTLSSSSPLKHAPASPSKASTASPVALQTSPAAGTLTRTTAGSAARPLSSASTSAGVSIHANTSAARGPVPISGAAAASMSRFSGFGMIRNLSSSLVGRGAAPTAEAPALPAREMMRRGSTKTGMQDTRRFLDMEAEDLTLRDVGALLAAYKALVVETEKSAEGKRKDEPVEALVAEQREDGTSGDAGA